MNEISAASVQQQNGVEQVNKAVIDMDGITQQNAALVEEIASSSEELSSQASELVSLASYFKVRNII
jgi:methyl-accepting chemotaxis protein